MEDILITIQRKPHQVHCHKLMPVTIGYWYLPLDESDDAAFESDYKSAGFTSNDLMILKFKVNKCLYLEKGLAKAGIVFLT